MKLLLVEDEAKLADIVRRACVRDGWAVDAVDNGADAIWHLTEFEYDVAVLDVGIPGPDGLEVCRQVREAQIWTPILFLTARDGVADRVKGLDAGGDDYLIKPFALDEFAARLRSLGRRVLAERPVRLSCGDLVLDSASRSVWRGSTRIDLSAKEFAVLEYLLRRKGEIVSRSELIDKAWDTAFGGTSNVVDVYVRYLRDKIDRPFDRRSIETIRGFGYRIDAEGDGMT